MTGLGSWLEVSSRGLWLGALRSPAPAGERPRGSRVVPGPRRARSAPRPVGASGRAVHSLAGLPGPERETPARRLFGGFPRRMAPHVLAPHALARRRAAPLARPLGGAGDVRAPGAREPYARHFDSSWARRSSPGASDRRPVRSETASRQAVRGFAPPHRPGGASPPHARRPARTALARMSRAEPGLHSNPVALRAGRLPAADLFPRVRGLDFPLRPRAKPKARHPAADRCLDRGAVRPGQRHPARRPGVGGKMAARVFPQRAVISRPPRALGAAGVSFRRAELRARPVFHRPRRFPRGVARSTGSSGARRRFRF
jgi:hypothetical protein